MAIENIIVPDIGGAEGVEVIELNVSIGSEVNEDDAIVTLESDKATMEVPAPCAGVIKTLTVSVGDKVNENSLVATIETKAASSASDSNTNAHAHSNSSNSATGVTTQQAVQTVTVPDVGGTEAVEVIEISVQNGDQVAEDQALITLESDKATMEVPAPFAGTVQQILVAVGDKVAEGTEVVQLMVTSDVVLNASVTSNATTNTSDTQTQHQHQVSHSKTNIPASSHTSNNISAGTGTNTAATAPAVQALVAAAQASAVDASIHASPVVRRIASEFGVNLRLVKPTGPKGRIVKEDVQLYVQQQLAAANGATTGSALPEPPQVDFAKFGDIETQPLNKIKKLTGKFLSRNWLLVPHVTQFNDADITDLEAFRQEEKAVAAKQGLKLTPLVFIMKAVVSALKQFPQFNASLAPDGSALILKKYFHLGVAVDTPEGLVVPVVRDVDQKGIFELAKELGELSAKARAGKLLPKEMQGACFTISSLGGIGGTAFTPIVNMPEVAILGVSKAQMKPVYQDKQFVPRLMLPLSLSYDHRVIDGAEGARFIMYLSELLADIRQLVM